MRLNPRRMTALRLFAISFLLAVSAAASAQFQTCTPPSIPYLDVNPRQADDRQTISITVGESSFNPSALTQSIGQGTIDVTMYGSPISMGLQFPPVCGTVQVGPLPAGPYQVRYFLGRATTGSPTMLLATTNLNVVGTAPVPALGNLAIVLLASAMALLAVTGLNRGRLRVR